MEKFQFPGEIGAIDCTHIPILKPREEEHSFVNRKGYHSLNVQIICDANLKILGINSNFPGSNHDSFIWRQSQIRDFLLHNFHIGMRRSWLIGDSGYPLEPILLTPFLNPAEGSPEAAFNWAHIRARNCIERCIGVLKMRFKCLSRERTARYTPNFMGKIVNACAVLHNLCLKCKLTSQMWLKFPTQLNLQNGSARDLPFAQVTSVFSPPPSVWHGYIIGSLGYMLHQRTSWKKTELWFLYSLSGACIFTLTTDSVQTCVDDRARHPVKTIVVLKFVLCNSNGPIFMSGQISDARVSLQLTPMKIHLWRRIFISVNWSPKLASFLCACAERQKLGRSWKLVH